MVESQQSGTSSAEQPRDRPWPRSAKIALLVLLAVKLVWAGGLPMCARWAVYDDALFIRQAATICQGLWLGPYDIETLMKGPGYPLFIAACHGVGVPLSLAQHLLHAAMCVLVVVALRPLLGPGLLLVIFALCLFDPLSFRTAQLSGTPREGIYPALTGLVVACSAAMLLRRAAPLKVLLGWALGFGLILGAFWLTREEGVWLLPSVLVLVAAGVGLTLRARPRDLLPRLSVWLLPFALCGGMVLAVCAINRSYYGVFAVNDVKQPQFTAGYGALMRVGQGEFKPRVVLPKNARRRLYELSPAFAELSPYFEGKPAEKWDSLGPRGKIMRDEIYGGWFYWALREAVAQAGHGDSAPESLAYYERLGQEVNALCDQGRIPCGSPCDSLIPPWNPTYWEPLLANVREAADYLVTWRGFRVRTPFSGGTEAQLELFRKMTGSTLTPPVSAEALRRFQSTERADPRAFAEDEAADGAAGPAANGPRLDLLKFIAMLFQRGTPFLVLAAVVAWVFQWVALVRGRRSPLLLLGLVLLIAIAIRLVLLSYLDLTVFPSINARYMAPLTPLLMLFCGVALADAWNAAAARVRRSGAGTAAPRA